MRREGASSFPYCKSLVTNTSNVFKEDGSNPPSPIVAIELSNNVQGIKYPYGDSHPIVGNC